MTTSVGAGVRRRRTRQLHAANSDCGRSEKDAKLAQKLGQLQHFIAVFPWELYSHGNTWANLHILGQPNTLLARATRHERAPEVRCRCMHRHGKGLRRLSQGVIQQPFGTAWRMPVPVHDGAAK